MKRLNQFLALVSLVAFVSCAKEAAVDQSAANPSQGPGLNPETCLIGFGASIEGLKASVDVTTGEVAFENGDEALVYIPATEQTGVYRYNGSSSIFEPKTGGDALDLGDNYAYVYYPAASFGGVSEGNATFTMPEAISAGSTESLGDKNPMSGLILAGSRDAEGRSQVVFKNLCSILRVRLTGNKDDQTAGKTVTSVALSNTTVPVAAAGAYTVSWNGHASEENVPTMATEATGTSMSITPSSLTLDSDLETDFYFLLPPTGTMENMAVTVTLSDAATYSRVRPSLPATRSKVISLNYRAGKYYDGVGTEADPFQIKTADDFRQISKLHAGEDASHRYYRQVADIDFGADADHKADLTGSMIGSSSDPFTGSYDGNGKSLKYFSISGTSPAGLFAYVSGAVIDDVFVSGFSVSGTKWLGGVVGYVNDASTIRNCEAADGTVNASEGESAGIVGRTQLTGSSITDCVNSASVTNNGAATKNNIAGILGFSAAEVTISDCSNSGTIDNQSGGQVGGIIGRCAGNVALSACSNSGNIHASNGNVGGIAGVLTGGSLNGASFSSGLVTSDAGGNVGGLVGKMDGLAISGGCYHSGIVRVSASQTGIGGLVGVMGSVTDNVVTTASTISGSCYNAGSVLCTVTGGSYIGGIAGRVYGGVIAECRNNGHVGGWNTTDGETFSGLNVNLNSVGGIVGLLNSGVVKECYGAPGSLIRGGERIGGLIGYISTAYDQRALLLNSFSRSNAQSCNSGTAALGGLVGHGNAPQQQVDFMNSLVWGSAILTNLNGSNTEACIGGLFGMSTANSTVNANIRNCMSACTRNSIRQRVGSTDTTVDKLNLEVYTTYGLLYGNVSGRTLLRDIFYRNAGDGDQYMGTNTSSYTGVRNMKTGLANNIFDNSTSTTLNLVKDNTTTYEFTGFMYEGFTRATYSPTNASNKIGGITYAETTYQMSDWVSVPALSGYSLPKALNDLGEAFYN